MPMVIATTYCLPRILRWSCIWSYCLFSLWGLYKVSGSVEGVPFNPLGDP
jgi:hypothetical protein